MSMALAVEAVQANHDAKLKKNMRVSVSNDVDPWQPNEPAVKYYTSMEPEGDLEDDADDGSEALAAYEEDDDLDRRSARRPGAGKAVLVLTACALLHKLFLAPARKERRQRGRGSLRENKTSPSWSHLQPVHDNPTSTAEDPLLAGMRAKLEQMSLSNDKLTNKINKLREEISAQLQNVRQPVLGVDRNGLITFWNQTAEILTGFDGPAIYEHEFVSTLVDPAEHGTLYQALSKVLSSGRCAELDEVSVRYQGGDVGKWAIAFSPTSEFGHTRAFVVCTDMSEIMRLRDQALAMRGECVSSVAKLTKMETTNKILQQQIRDLQNEPRPEEEGVRTQEGEQLEAALMDLEEMTSKYNMQKDAALSAEARVEELRLVNDSQSKEMAELVKMMHQLSAEAHKIAQSNRELMAANIRLEEREATLSEQLAKRSEELADHVKGKMDDDAAKEAVEGNSNDSRSAREELLGRSHVEVADSSYLDVETSSPAEYGTGAMEACAATTKEAEGAEDPPACSLLAGSTCTGGGKHQQVSEQSLAQGLLAEKSSLAEAEERALDSSGDTGVIIARPLPLETQTAFEDETAGAKTDPGKPRAVQTTHTQDEPKPNLQTSSTILTSCTPKATADESPPLAEMINPPEETAIEDATAGAKTDPGKPRAGQTTQTQDEPEPDLQTSAASFTSCTPKAPIDESAPLAEMATGNSDARVRCTLGQTQRRLDLEQASHPAFILTSSGEVALWNAAAARSVMRRRDDVLGRSLSGFLWGSDAAARLDKMLKASESESVVAQELALMRSDLGVVSWQASCMCVRDAGGEVLEYVCTVKRTTEPKNASSRLTPRSMSEATDPVSLAKAETAQILAKLQEYGVPNARMVAKGIYDVVGRRIIIVVRHSKEMVRVGGGYVPLGKFLRQYDTRGYAASSCTTPSQSGTSTPVMTPRGSRPISRNASVNNSPPERGPSDTCSHAVANSAPVRPVSPRISSKSHPSSQAAAHSESSSECVDLTEVRANTVSVKAPGSAEDAKPAAGGTVPKLDLGNRNSGASGSERNIEVLALASPMSTSSHKTSDEFHTPRSNWSGAHTSLTGSGDRHILR